MMTDGQFKAKYCTSKQPSPRNIVDAGDRLNAKSRGIPIRDLALSLSG